MSNDLSPEIDVYRVEFLDQFGNQGFVDVPRHRGMADIKEGIWVNNNYEYDLMGDFWIPPSRFVLVTVVRAKQ